MSPEIATLQPPAACKQGTAMPAFELWAKSQQDHPLRGNRLGAFLFRAALLAGLGVLVVRSAWVTEDAYIMFRTIDNFLRGDGLTWNVTERVQAYTCPLWLFALTPWIAATGEFYFTSIAVGCVATLGAATVFLWRLAPSKTAAALALAAFASSKAFIDYSTSALENPLTHLLLALYGAVFFRAAQAPSVAALFRVALVASLGMVNRLDTALLFLPSLVWLFCHVPKRQGLLAGLVGMTPVIAWEVFSLVYYGFLFPNTAYAKLNLGISAQHMCLQGLCYYANAFRCDPVTLVIIGMGLAAPCLGRRWHEVPLAIGVALYLVYIIKIGGDYMSGRFFTAPLVLAVVLLCRAGWAQKPAWAVPCLLALLGLSALNARSPLYNGSDFGTEWASTEVDQWGIADERGYYYPSLGLLRVWEVQREGRMPLPMALEQEREAKRQLPGQIKIAANIGMSIFRAPAQDYVIDRCALGDAFTARLPMEQGWWRVGHYLRLVPLGYMASVRFGYNCFPDPQLGAYYDKLKLITSGPLWSRARWRAIWEMNTGQLEHLIDVDNYRRRREPPAS
jgi:arabinofuranosyltransferase